jgi:type VI secretion system protein ImpM
MSSEIPVGFFGKVPNLGDFVERRVHPGIRSMWDQWLQDGLAASHEDLGDGWLDIYLFSPVWRFALSTDVCGEAVYAGVMVPSVDSVGRYFPLTVIASLPPDTACLPLLSEGTAWFKAVESTLLDILDGTIAETEDIERQLSELERPLADTVARLAPIAFLKDDLDLTLSVADPDHFCQEFVGLADMNIRNRLATPTYWLTDGSDRMSPRLLVVRGLPPPSAFAAMLSGDFSPSAWQSVAFERVKPESPAAAAFPDAVLARAVTSSVRSDRGHVRARNEDYAAARPDRNLWVVADGMGGYEDGALASAAVCDAVDKVEWHGTLGDKVDLIIEVLRSLNTAMRLKSEAAVGEIVSASTVVILLIEGSEWACIWAGDSRLYRFRKDSLEQLSIDHSIGDRNSTDSDGQEYFVTAGLGVGDELIIDVLRGELETGDRFLLCTDGVYDAVDQAAIVRALAQDDAQLASFSLINAVLEGPASDNATVAVVFTS